MHRLIVPAIAVLGLIGCIDQNEEYTLNPDASGKVVVRMIYNPMGFSFSEGEKEDPKQAMKDSVRTEMEKAEGVETWKDVSFKLRDDGKVEFHGTAYFRNFAKLKLHRQGFDGPLKKPLMKKLAGGSCEILFPMDENASSKPAKDMTDAEIDQKVKADRAKFQQMKAVMGSALKDMKFTIRLRLPGTLTSSNNMKKSADGLVGFSLEGTKMLEAMEALASDDAWMRDQIKKGGSGIESGDALTEKLLGSKGAVKVVYAPGAKALFDYAAETAAAKAAFPAMVKRLGVEVAQPAPPAQGGSFKSLKILGVRMVYETDSRKGVMPLNTNEPGLTFSVLGELPGRVLSIGKGKLLTAVAANGQDLLPERDWNRKINFPRLTEDKQSALFEIQMKLPPKGSNVLKEVSGMLEYSVGGKVEEKDLGLPGLTAGAQGKEFGAKIEKVGKSDWQKGYQKLELKLAIEREKIESVVFYDASGNELEVNPSGYMSSGRSTTLSFSRKEAFPAKGRIALKIYADMKKYEAPFKLENVPILGR